jgi:membrane fusion protein, multidrug efflux system
METQVAELERGAGAMPPRQESKNAGGVRTNPKARRAIVAGAILVAAIGLGLYVYYSGRVSTDDAEVDGHIVPMASKIYGTVAEVLVNDNQQVKTGQVLVRIDPRDYQAKVDQARAALQTAEAKARGANISVPWTNEVTLSATSDAAAQLAAAEANDNRAKAAYQQASTADLAYAQAEVQKAQASSDKAQADLERMKPLAAKAEISQQELDGYVAAARESASELRAAREKLASARQSSDIARSALQAADAQVRQAQAAVGQARANRKEVDVQAATAASAAAAIAQARADLEAAELNLSYTAIAAPLDGVITRKSVEVGEIVQPGQDLFVIVPLTDVWVTANFKETQLADVHPGQKAEVHVDMYGRTFTGHVDSIAGATGSRLSLLPPENATGNFVKVVQRIPVKILLDPVPAEKAILRPGMNVDATIITK